MIEVAAGIIHRADKLLICQRGADGDCANLWEFPGGKREVGESFAQCLERECREELGIRVCAVRPVAETVYIYPERTVHLSFWEAQWLEGTLEKRVHAQMVWVAPGELGNYAFCPADRDIVLQLQKG